MQVLLPKKLRSELWDHQYAGRQRQARQLPLVRDALDVLAETGVAVPTDLPTARAALQAVDEEVVKRREAAAAKLRERRRREAERAAREAERVRTLALRQERLTRDW